ncbi:unnamed protein product [Cutaneotrichosporon oleaginosum]
MLYLTPIPEQTPTSSPSPSAHSSSSASSPCSSSPSPSSPFCQNAPDLSLPAAHPPYWCPGDSRLDNYAGMPPARRR